MSNLQKLNNAIDKYYANYLKLPLEKNYIDVHAIAQQTNKLHIIRLVFSL